MMVMTRESLDQPGPAEGEHRHEPSSAHPTAPPTGPLPAEALVAQAVAAGTGDPRRVAELLLAAAGGSRERLSGTRLILSERLHLRSDDLEATLAMRIVERALAQAPYPDGPWRWQQQLSPRRIRAFVRRRARQARRRSAHPLRRRANWRTTS